MANVTSNLYFLKKSLITKLKYFLCWILKFHINSDIWRIQNISVFSIMSHWFIVYFCQTLLDLVQWIFFFGMFWYLVKEDSCSILIFCAFLVYSSVCLRPCGFYQFQNLPNRVLMTLNLLVILEGLVVYDMGNLPIQERRQD